MASMLVSKTRDLSSILDRPAKNLYTTEQRQYFKIISVNKCTSVHCFITSCATGYSSARQNATFGMQRSSVRIWLSRLKNNLIIRTNSSMVECQSVKLRTQDRYLLNPLRYISSVGTNACLSRMRSRFRVPQVPLLIGLLVQLARTLTLQAKGHEFESHTVHI